MDKINATFPGKRVLVVEDHLINQEVIRAILELMECDVDTAENGPAAITKHAQSNYDLIFMDIQMPGQDGYQTTQTIRNAEVGRVQTPIIALTANALAGDREKCLSAGMNDYLSKPIELSQIEEILKKYLA